MFTKRRFCVLCNNTNLAEMWDLPKFPLTGIYLNEFVQEPKDYFFDQKLQYCSDCDFLQLESQVDPKLLYQETYSHFTSKSKISSVGNLFLKNFIEENVELDKVDQILEIGCNDLLLLKTFDPKTHKVAGQDPIWGEETREIDGIKIMGGFAETCDLTKVLQSKIDLVISAHTFEHVFEPHKVLENISHHTSDDCIFVLEVPSANRMFQQLRLDQIFNQHVNHYTINSLIKLFMNFGFKLMKTEFNYSYWGGTQLLIFQKRNDLPTFISNFKELDRNYILDSIKSFNSGIEFFRKQISYSSHPILAYGAAQMLPILSYHIGSEFNHIEKILDDNEGRQGKYFPGLDIEIVRPSSVKNANEYVSVVTALDSASSVIDKLLKLNTKNILLPLGCISS